jgi:hypothetical protein
MKLTDIFRKKSKITKTEKSVVKIDKKQLSKIVGGMDTILGGVVTDNKHPEGKYL